MTYGERTFDRSGALKAGIRKARELGSGEIARASAVSLGIRLTGLALSFAQAVLTARLLGAEGYGIVAVTMSAVQVLATICLFGFGPLAVREIPARLAAGERAGISAFLRYAFAAALGLSIAGGAALGLIAGATDWVRPAYRTAFEVGGLIVVPLTMVALFRGIAQGFARIPIAQAPGEVIQPAAILLVLAAVALFGLRFGPADFLWSALAAALLAAVAGGAWLWRAESANVPGTREGSARRGGFAAAFPFVALALAGMLQGEMNTLLLGWLGSTQQAGLFQPVVRIASVLVLPAQAAGMRFAPRVAELWQRGETERIRSVTRKFTLTTTALTLGVALAIAAAGPWLMWLFGPEFRQSAPLLWVVAAAQVFNAACGPVGMLLTMGDRSGWALNGQLAGVAANAVVAIVLIPTYGAWGAVIAMTSGIVVWNVAMLAMARLRYGFDPSVVECLFRTRP